MSKADWIKTEHQYIYGPFWDIDDGVQFRLVVSLSERPIREKPYLEKADQLKDKRMLAHRT